MPTHDRLDISHLRVGPWKLTNSAIQAFRNQHPQGVWVVERDRAHPFWTDEMCVDERSLIDHATAPFGGTAVVKLLSRFSEHEPRDNHVTKTNRELVFARSQLLTHPEGPPRHLVETLAIDDVLAGSEATDATIVERIRDLEPEERHRFGQCRAAIVMVRYDVLGRATGVNENFFFDRLAVRVAGGSHADDPLDEAVSRWLSREPYEGVWRIAPRAVVAHSLLEVARQVLAGVDEAATRLRRDRPGEFVEFLHRDIKPENLFVDGDANVRLGDFGHAIDADDSGVTSEKDPGGTYFFRSPEGLLRPYAERTGADDVWALGMTLATLWVSSLAAHRRDYSQVPSYEHDRMPLTQAGDGDSIEDRAGFLADHARHRDLLATMPRSLAAVVGAMLTTDQGCRPDTRAAAHLVDQVLHGDSSQASHGPIDDLQLSGAAFAELGSVDSVVAASMATAFRTGGTTANATEQLLRAGDGHPRLNSLGVALGLTAARNVPSVLAEDGAGEIAEPQPTRVDPA